MKLGFFSDVHGNLEALTAVIEQLKLEGCDTIVHGGDAIGQGLYPTECIDLMNENGVETLNGNYEQLMCDYAGGMQKTGAKDRETQGHEWTYEKLTTAQLDAFRDQALIADFDDNGIAVRCCHYAVDPVTSRYKKIRRDYTRFMFRELFGDVIADCVLFGHDHASYQFCYDKVFINPGPVGYAQESVVSYCTIMLERPFSYTVRRVPYNMERYVRDLKHSKFPNREYVILLLTLPPNISKDEALRRMYKALGKKPP